MKRETGPERLIPNPQEGATLDPKDVTATLHAAAAGDPAAVERLFPVVYEELRRRAAAYLRRERPDHTLQPTALAHEAYLKLAAQEGLRVHDRAHFMALAARAMRSILVDHARRRRAQKRGGGRTPASLDSALVVSGPDAEAFDDLDRALTDLARRSERQARVVELRYFGGLTVEEVATVLDASPATVKRDWITARAWLYRELAGPAAGGD